MVWFGLVCFSLVTHKTRLLMQTFNTNTTTYYPKYSNENKCEEKNLCIKNVKSKNDAYKFNWKRVNYLAVLVCPQQGLINKLYQN